MTKAARNALAWVHLRKKMPKFLHNGTWRAVYACVESVGLERHVKADCLPLIENHPMVAKVRELEADGWQLDPNDRNYKVRYGVEMIRGQEEIRVWTNGKVS